MNAFVPEWKFLDELLASLDAEKKVLIQIQSGLPYFCLRMMLADRSLFVITDEAKAESLADETQSMRNLFDPLKEWSVGFLPEKLVRERSVLFESALQSKGIVWFGTAESFREKAFSKQAFLGSRLVLKVGKTLNYDKLLNYLAQRGYHRQNFVEDEGEFAVRGEVFDFWSPNYDQPVRLVFSNDVIESLHFFDPFTQRTINFSAEIILLPLSETDAAGSVNDHLPSNCVMILDRSGENFEIAAPGLPVIEIVSDGRDAGLVPSVKINLNWELFKRELRKHRESGVKSFVFCRNVGETQRLEDILDEMQCRDDRPQILVGSLSQGFVSPPLKIAVWSFSELSGSTPVVRRLPKFKMGRSFESIAELKLGDYVVHESYGIARYRGLERISLKSGRTGSRAREKESEFLALEYRAGDRLLVPIQDFRLIQKYIGAEGKKPRLYSLDGIAWERMKQKVRQEVQDIAKDLLQIAALRATVFHPADGTPTADHLYREFSEAFPYEETPDQWAAIHAVEKDLDSPQLMDRLVCGDVGYGKTEIAMRASFKVVCESKQVAVLVPTTILAEQHYKTFADRFRAFPVRIAMLSRFVKPSEQKEIMDEAKAGLVDILIGTHRLLQKDVRFKNLGLVVVDEEHRFGVQQKELLKQLKLTADILTLSATPIPRTLSLALGGVREISIIETPPEGRLPIETYVGSFDEIKLLEAVEREVSRGGQIFYVHNRVQTIESRKMVLEKMFPRLKIGLAHGQMSGESLEKAMWNFLNRKWDILLSTTIIESGLDIPNVNTLIVEDSDEFGLAQLYQLRGRVGRQREKAYCYLFFSEWGGLSEDARKRLQAIQEFSALGSGMKLAIRDMEIRGTGNLLGAQQHGWISAVGLDLYCQMLSQEIQKLKSSQGIVVEKTPAQTPLPEVELDIPAFIPETYVESEGERILLYRKMIACRTEAEIEKLKSEFQDRFGLIPDPAAALFRLIQLKIQAHRLKISSMIETNAGILFAWPVVQDGVPLDLVRLAKDHPDLIEISTSASLINPANQKEAGTQSPDLKILFKSDSNDAFTAVEKFLQIIDQYVKL